VRSCCGCVEKIGLGKQSAPGYAVLRTNDKGSVTHNMVAYIRGPARTPTLKGLACALAGGRSNCDDDDNKSESDSDSE
jgi:hypothetical protein